jgi:transcriptional regulator with XRE-family HTH domain
MKKSPNPTWQVLLGNQIREARIRKGFSRATLARMLGERNRETIRLYELGKIAPPLPVMRTIVALLESDFDVHGCRIAREIPALKAATPSQQLPLQLNLEVPYQKVLVRFRASSTGFVLDAQSASEVGRR